jgi:uncharacterized protein (TIGR02996 family)
MLYSVRDKRATWNGRPFNVTDFEVAEDDTLTAINDMIVRYPYDDTHRLVAADRLDDLGGEWNEARAEFIRVQCALAGSTVLGPRPKQDLVAREAELYGFLWPMLWDRQYGVAMCRYTCTADPSLTYFSRGFVSRASGPINMFNYQVPHLTLQTYPITEIDVADRIPDGRTAVGRWRWWNFGSYPHGMHRSCLPTRYLDQLVLGARYCSVRPSRCSYVEYENADDPLLDISRVLVADLRAWLKLPPLPENEVSRV